MDILAHSSQPQTSSFTCNSCSIRFPTAELQRLHMKTDWHRYNLKRRVAQLGPITASVFAEKVISQQEGNDEPEEDEYGFVVNKRKTKHTNRQLTKKDLKKQEKLDLRGRVLTNGLVHRDLSPASSIATEASHFSLGASSIDSHLYHTTDNESNVDTASEYNLTDHDHGFTEDDSSDSEEEDEELAESYASESDFDQLIPNTVCIFCGANNKEIELNIQHMFQRHGLYIPERSYLTNVSGLLEYLSSLVSVDKECLVCNFQGKTLESIRQHMTAKGHCSIPYDTKEDRDIVSVFYDFSSLEEQPKKASNKKKVAFGDYDVVENNPEEAEEEDVSSDDVESRDDRYSLVQLDKTGVELILPTGSRVGHRSMQRIYRQNLRLDRVPNDGEMTVALAGNKLGVTLTPAEIKETKQVRRLQQKANSIHQSNTMRRSNIHLTFRDPMLGG